jgi:membrane protein YqaA with SNARE-associated domain
MCLARPRRAWRFATLCTLASVAGGLVGYLVGLLAFHYIEGWLAVSRWAPAFEQAVAAFETHGFWYILLAGFTPVPYKVFTISAGVVGMPVWSFLAGSMLGRGGRFFLVAGLIRLGGERFAERLRGWVDLIGWSVLALVLLGFTAWKLGWIG